MAALRKLGVRCVVAFSAVGSLMEEVRPRDFLVPDQVFDRTKGVGYPLLPNFHNCDGHRVREVATMGALGDCISDRGNGRST